MKQYMLFLGACVVLIAGCSDRASVAYQTFSLFVDTCRRDTVRHEWLEGSFKATCELKK
jgi:hypothetical protein